MSTQQPPTHEDAQWLAAWVETRDQTAFRALAEKYTPLVFGAAVRRVGRRDWAEEVAQNVLTALARKAPALTGAGGLGGWLHRAAVLESASLLRAERRREARLRSLAADSAASHDTPSAEWGSLCPHLDEAISALADDDRRVVMLHYFEQRSFAEVARALRITHDAARKRGQRALDKLGRALRRRGVTLSAAALAAHLTASLTQAAPPGLAGKSIDTALAPAPAATGLGGAWLGGKLGAAAAAALAFCLPAGWEVQRQHALAAVSTATPAAAAARAQAAALLPDPFLQSLAAALALPLDPVENPERFLEVSVLISQLPADKLPAVWAMLRERHSREGDPATHSLTSVLFARWAELDTPAASALVRGRFEFDSLREPAWHGLGRVWAVKDPDAFLAALRSTGGPDLWLTVEKPSGNFTSSWQAQIVEHLALMLGADHFSQATKLAAVLPEGESHQRTLSKVLSRHAMVDTGETGRWIAAHLPGKPGQEMINSLAQGLNQPEHLQALLEFQTDPASKVSSICGRLIPRLFHRSHEEGLRFLADWPESQRPQDYPRTVGDILSVRATPAEASAFLEQVADPRAREDMLSVWIPAGCERAGKGRLGTLTDHLEAALSWLPRITRSGLRRDTAFLLVEMWKKTDREAALAWYRATDLLTPQEKIDNPQQ